MHWIKNAPITNIDYQKSANTNRFKINQSQQIVATPQSSCVQCNSRSDTAISSSSAPPSGHTHHISCGKFAYKCVVRLDGSKRKFCASSSATRPIEPGRSMCKIQDVIRTCVPGFMFVTKFVAENLLLEEGNRIQKETKSRTLGCRIIFKFAIKKILGRSTFLSWPQHIP